MLDTREDVVRDCNARMAAISSAAGSDEMLRRLARLRQETDDAVWLARIKADVLRARMYCPDCKK